MVNQKLFGARIRQAREAQGLSQDELASLVSKDQRSISEYENGRRRVSAIDVPVFAKALRVSILFFYEGEISSDDLDRAALNHLRRLPTPEAKRIAIEMLELLSHAVNLHSE
ncbi:MAG: helix-turn-helix transcriptional regulator [Chloroflexi bacterium]|nr:helix-turn-helix transcriptional regulator [Chloroflexota bacterium]